MERTFGNAIGSVYFNDFDAGMATSLNAVPDGNNYKVTIEGIGTDIPIIFNSVEQVIDDQTLPLIVILRESTNYQVNRTNRNIYDYRVGTDDNSFISKMAAWPVDINYSVRLYTTSRSDDDVFSMYFAKKILQNESVTVTDSNDTQREYSAFLSTSEKLVNVSSVDNEIIGSNHLVRVEAEIDIYDEVNESVITTTTVTSSLM